MVPMVKQGLHGVHATRNGDVASAVCAPVRGEESQPRVDDAPLRVCVLAGCPFPANHGTPGSIREMTEATAERGHEVHVVCYHMGEDLPLANVHLHRIPDWTGERTVTVGPTRRRPLYDFQMVFKTISVMR